jgi:hypothetical protein
VCVVCACVGRGSAFDSRLGCNFLPCPISHAPALGSLARATFHSLPCGLRSFTRTLRRSTSSRSTATVRRSTQRRPFLHICAAASSALLGLFGATPTSAHVTQRVRLVCQACFQRCGCDRLPSRARARAHIIRNAGARQMRRLHRGTPRSLSTEHGVSQRLRVICMRRTRVCAQNGAGQCRENGCERGSREGDRAWK